MKLHLLCASLLLLITNTLLAGDATEQPILATYQADWLVVGAGPAGISAVAALLDAAVKPENIIWVDDAFNVGSLGKDYYHVPPNSTAATFFSYVKQSAHLFRYINLFRSLSLPQPNLHLGQVSNPLRIITAHFRQVIANVQGRIDNLSYDAITKLWTAKLPAIRFDARNVILAIGAHPKQLTHTQNLLHIPLEEALTKHRLNLYLKEHNAVAVFGSSHSAALALHNLVSLQCPHIVHVYNHEFRFRRKTKRGEVYPFSGLKGPVGKWAKEHLNDASIIHTHVDAPETETLIAGCTAVIDAVGFEPNQLPVDPKDLYKHRTNPHELGPHLYGVGIAFPDEMQDIDGNIEKAVGLLSFMKTIKRELPDWMSRK